MDDGSVRAAFLYKGQEEWVVCSPPDEFGDVQLTTSIKRWGERPQSCRKFLAMQAIGWHQRKEACETAPERKRKKAQERFLDQTELVKALCKVVPERTRTLASHLIADWMWERLGSAAAMIGPIDPTASQVLPLWEDPAVQNFRKAREQALLPPAPPLRPVCLAEAAKQAHQAATTVNGFGRQLGQALLHALGRTACDS